MNDVRFAVVGCGAIGNRHAALIKQKAILSAVCDIDRGKADQFASLYGCKAYYDMTEMLNDMHDVDAVSICTPNYLHAPQSVLALNSGKHVLCEKPMALSVEECLLMIKARDAGGKQLAVVKQNRFNPPVVFLKKLIDNGTMGRILTVNVNCIWNRDEQYYQSSAWKGKSALDGGVLFTQFSHFIDLMYWLAGEAVHLQSYQDNFLHKQTIELEDSGCAIVRFRNGALGSLTYSVNAYGKNAEGSLTVIAERGTVRIGGEYLNRLDYVNVKGIDQVVLPDAARANDYGSYQGSMSNHDMVYDNFLSTLTGNEQLSASAEEALETVRFICNINRAAK